MGLSPGELLPQYGLARAITTAGALEAAREGATLVTANRRLARSLREQYHAARVAAGDAVWTAPQILPWGAWLGSLWEQRLYRAANAVPPLLTPGQEQFLWERIIAESPDAERLISVSATADAASNSWSLVHAWQLDRGEIEAVANDDTRAFLGWSDSFEYYCRKEEWLDAARLPNWLASSLDPAGAPESVLLAGFDEFTPQQEMFLRACAGAGSLIVVVEPPRTAPGAAVRIACADRRSESAAAARWARALLERGERSIGVIVPDLAARRREVARTFRDILEPAAVLPGACRRGSVYNLSAGAALSEYPLVRAAFLALELDTERNEIGAIGAFLRLRYLRGASAERSRRAALDARLRKLGAAQVSVRLVRDFASRPDCACPELLGTLAAWQKAREAMPASQRPGAWAHGFSQLLSRLGWPGDAPLASGEYQVSEAWGRLLSDFARLDAVGARFSYGQALARLRRMASAAMFQPESEAAPVQVLGALEAAGKVFDHLWIAGMDGEAWPPPARPDPFIPALVQRAHGLPHSSPERELEFAKLATERLLAASPDVVFSHALRDGDRDLGVSPLVRGIAAAGLDAPECPSFCDVIRASARIDRFTDATGPAAERDARGGANIFKYQALCPFRAFAELRLGAAPIETPEDGLGRRDRGTLVHLALEAVWRELETHARLCASSEDELQAAIRRSVEFAIESIAGRRGAPLPPRFAQLERARLAALIAEWLEIEKTREPFRVIEREASREIQLNGIRANVRIDRIDRLADGRELIIDYKTGEPNASDWEGERPADPQVPLYAVNHDGRLGAALFAQVKTGKAAFKGVAGEPAPVPRGLRIVDMREQVQAWRATLGQLALAFLGGRAEVDPKKPETCRTCTLAPLCRIAEADLDTSALAGEGR